jgi:hypothetical protein
MKKVFLTLLLLVFPKINAQNLKVELLMEVPGISFSTFTTTPMKKVIFVIPSLSTQKFDTNLYVYDEDKNKLYGVKNYFPIYRGTFIRWIGGDIFYIYTNDSLDNVYHSLSKINFEKREAHIIKELPEISFFDYVCLYPPLRLLVKWDKNENAWRVHHYILDSLYNVIVQDTIGPKITHPVKEGWWPPAFTSETKNWVFFIIYNLFYNEGSILIGINKSLNKIVPITFTPSSPAISNYAGVWQLYSPPHKTFKVFYVKELNDTTFELSNFYKEINDTADVYPLGSISNYNFYGFSFGNSKKISIEIFNRISGESKIIFLKSTSHQWGLLIDGGSIFLNDKVYFILATQGTPQYSWIYKIEVDSVITTDNDINPKIIPLNFALYQNYPNPFNSSTTIEFDILERTNVKLVVYDILGREVETLIDKELEPGKYKVNFEAKDLPSGVYFYTLRTPKFTKTNKMILIK